MSVILFDKKENVLHIKNFDMTHWSSTMCRKVLLNAFSNSFAINGVCHFLCKKCLTKYNNYYNIEDLMLLKKTLSVVGIQSNFLYPKDNKDFIVNFNFKINKLKMKNINKYNVKPRKIKYSKIK